MVANGHYHLPLLRCYCTERDVLQPSNGACWYRVAAVVDDAVEVDGVDGESGAECELLGHTSG
jgi:hypothetical protein